MFDGLHTYNTAGHLRGKEPDQVRSGAATTYPTWVRTARQAGRLSTLTVIPGYDDTKIPKPGLAVDRFVGYLLFSASSLFHIGVPHSYPGSSHGRPHEIYVR